MSINLDTEKGLQRKPKKFRKPNSERMNQENNSNSENKKQTAEAACYDL